LTNDNSTEVKVQMYFINGDAPLDPVFDAQGNLIERGHPGWNWLDNEITLTANQPTYWSAFTGQPASGGLSPFTALDPGVPPGRPDPENALLRHLRGYIIGWAVNSDGQEIRFNHLAGNGTIVNYALGYAWEYLSWNHAVVSGVAEGQQPDGVPGQLLLNGAEYSPSYDQLLFNFQAAGSAAFSGAGVQVVSNTDLTLFPESVDLRQTTDGPVTTKANFDIWNMNEVKFSGTHRCITCWDQTLISNYEFPNHMLVFNLQTAHGKARIDGHQAPIQCDVLDDPETPEDESVTSVAAALLGVAARILIFDGGQRFGAAGYNLVGMGTQNAEIKYDVITGSQEAESAPQDPVKVLDWVEKAAGVSTKVMQTKTGARQLTK
jgi:hypothetical protein